MSRSTGRTIRGRIIRTVAPPLAAMLVLLAVVAATELSRYRVATASESRATLIISVQTLVQDLQGERAATVALVGGNTAFRAQVGPARERVDSRRDAMESALAGGGPVEREAVVAVGNLNALTGIRVNADRGLISPDDTFESYTGLIEHLTQVYRNLELIADEGLRNGLESLEYLNGLIEDTAQEQAFLSQVFTSGGFEADQYPDFVAILTARDHDLGEFDEFASPAVAAAKTTLFNSEAANQARGLEEAALRSGGVRKLLVDRTEWWGATSAVLDDMTRLAKQIGVTAQADAKTLRRDATVRLGVLTVIVLLCLAGTVYLAVSGSRSLAGPLAMLAGEADLLARERLPEAVRRAVSGDVTGPPEPVRPAAGASVEVRKVADAFDRVQETAYRLATEQAQLRRTSAESLANLGRRNQNLLRRQLGFITRLEREESNPAGLANLFELDHLATRMRRNAESLLVLVGAASPRQWSEQLPLADVIRAAVSEVEEYRRVILRRMDDALIKGSVASDVAHLLAELIENGLTFSPPDLEVEIHGRRLGEGYLIAICDQGIGMNQDELDHANERLRGDGDFLTAPARFLGHYVVGRLANEMGAEVRLTTSPVVGVTARVILPARILGAVPAVGSGAHREPETTELPAVSSRPVQTPPRVEIDYVVVGQRAPVPAPRPPVSPAATGLIVSEVERTANGLRKRVPRENRPPSAPMPAGRPAEPSAPIVDTPAAVFARLTALRDGVERGQFTASAARDRSTHPLDHSDLGGVS